MLNLFSCIYQEIIKPYVNAYEENKSLQVVIDMKTAEYQKLKADVSLIPCQFIKGIDVQ